MNIPKMKPVISSNIAAVGYDPESKSVFVQFLAGTVYVYKNVPKSEFDELLMASSLGSYLNKNFKGVYPYELVD